MLSQLSPMLLLSAVLLGLVLLKDNTVKGKCYDLLNHGRWSSENILTDKYLRWQPFGSMLHVYDKSSLSNCLSDRTLYFIGDSTVRQVFWATAAKYDKTRAQRENAEAGKHQSFLHRNDQVYLSFIWDPYLNSTQTREILNDTMAKRWFVDQGAAGNEPTAGIIISTGLWHARYSGNDFANEYHRTLSVLTRYRMGRPSSPVESPDAYLSTVPVIVLPPPVLNHHWLNPERAAALNPERLGSITDELLSFQNSSDIEVAWSARTMTKKNLAAMSSGGLHVTGDLASYQADIFLNRICNNIMFERTNRASSLPCVRQTLWKVSPAFGLEVALMAAVLFYTMRASQRNVSTFWPRLRAIVIMASTVFYCWLADRTLLFGKGDKLVQLDLFVILTTVIVAAAAVRVRHYIHELEQHLPYSKPQETLARCKTSLIPRMLTEEWKGWMQIVILLYHYFGMSRVLAVYQLVRVLVASYLFLTGYGHAAYFLKKNDSSVKRIATVTLRLNLLTCILSFTMDNNHDFYYFPALATLWFWITCIIFRRRKGRQISTRELFARILVAYTGCLMVVRYERLLGRLFSFATSICGPQINAKEFVFRFGLDLLAPFVGMGGAIIEARDFCHEKRRCTSWSLPRWVLSLLRMVMFVSSIGMYILAAKKLHDKVSYNQWHWALSILPITAYINARTALWNLSSYYSAWLAWIGSFSLELFVLQYHIWLADDTKGLLRLGTIDIPATAMDQTTRVSRPYWLETFTITIIFFWLSNQCSHATNTLVEWFIGYRTSMSNGNERNLVIRVLVALTTLWLLNVLSTVN